MKVSKYLRYAGIAVAGVILALSYMKFLAYYQELNHAEENFVFIYEEPALRQGIAEECHKYQIGCEIWNIGKEGISGEKSEISAVMVKGVGALSYHEAQNLFLDSNVIIDVNLLKWIVYIIIFFCFSYNIVFCFRQNKGWGNKRRFYFMVMFMWLLHVKIFIFSGMADFPVWSLPGKWSDMQGWGELGKAVLEQVSYTVRFKDYPVICKYYEGVIKSIFYFEFPHFVILQCQKVYIKK